MNYDVERDYTILYSGGYWHLRNWADYSVTEFDHYPSDEEIHAALAMYRIGEKDG